MQNYAVGFGGYQGDTIRIYNYVHLARDTEQTSGPSYTVYLPLVIK